MTPDARQREEALDARRSFIVEAPAGSGKTGLLTQRFLRLLSEVERPESIVAMTFTRKAAAEMKERIHGALLDAKSGQIAADEHKETTRKLASSALAQDRRKGWNLLADMSQLQIQTIDSLCAMLTRQMPVISEFGGVGKVVEDARELYRLAAREMLRGLTEGEEEGKALFRRVVLHFDNDMSRLEQQVANMLQKRDQWEFLAGSADDSLVNDFCGLLDRARDSLREVFSKTATVDFAEVARAARKALGKPECPTDLLYSLDYRIQHLLVDEFQDTSRAQYDLLKALTEQWSDTGEHTLFVVGDPMQSIYRFREAEVGLFLDCWDKEQLGCVRLHRLSLETNFRSTPEIVSWVAEKIGPTMVEDAVKFRPSTAVRGRTGVDPKLISFFEDNGQLEAIEIVKVVKATTAKSTAILVRSRSHVNAILPALRRAEIPYRAIEIDALETQQHIIDLLSLTRAILHLADRVSWLACLRAPWCGLTLADLAALAEREPNRTILDLLSDAAKIAALSVDGRFRAVRAQEILAKAVEDVGRLPLRKLVEGTWFALGGPAVLGENSQFDDAQTYLDLLENLEEGGIIRDFSVLNQRLETFYARPSVKEGCVDVMTIHQAKGLEFDVVIIPQLARVTKTSDRDLLVWNEEMAAALPRRGERGSEYERICKEMDQKEAEEMKRLLYVACTRAKNELYLCGSANRKGKDGELKKPGHNTFLGLIWPSVEEQFKSEMRRRVPVQQSFDLAEDKAPKTVLRRLPLEWHAPKLDRGVKWQQELKRATASERRITYEWVSSTSRHVGTVVHEFLKRGAPTDAAIVKAELLRLGVPTTDEPEATKQAIRAVTNTLKSTRGQWILAKHADSQAEVPIAGRIEGKFITAIIDRVFRDDEGRLWIVDYKNSEHKGGNREAFLDEEKRRYSAQLQNYGTLISRIERGPIWLGLYFPLLDAWREWQFTEETVAAN